MQSDRYLKAILTVIALELLWLGMRGAGTPVAAQAQPAPTPVIIRGININETESRGSLPVDLVRTHDDRPISVQTERPLRVEALRPLRVDFDQPVKIEAEKPLPVQSVPYTPSQRPGE